MQIQSCQKKIQVYPFFENTTVSVKNAEFFFYQKEPSFFFNQKVPHDLQKNEVHGRKSPLKIENSDFFDKKSR